MLLGALFYTYSRRFPEHAKKLLVGGVKRMVPNVDVEKHFTPRYNPWDQRLCLVPDADLFAALREGTVSVVTDEIESFTETGIALKSGEQLEADIIVTATGLKLRRFGGLALTVDGTPVEIPKAMVYKGMMLSDVPNLAFAVGYTNASWTLKCDLTSRYVCRLVNHLDKHGFTECAAAPRSDDGGSAAARFHVGLRAACDQRVPTPGREGAVEALPELPARSVLDRAVEARRRRAAVHLSAARASGISSWAIARRSSSSEASAWYPGSSAPCPANLPKPVSSVGVACAPRRDRTSFLSRTAAAIMPPATTALARIFIRRRTATGVPSRPLSHSSATAQGAHDLHIGTCWYRRSEILLALGARRR